MAIDWTKIYKKYKGKWVALKEDERSIAAYGITAKEAYAKAIEKGYLKPILTRIPEKISLIVGFINLHEI